MGSGTVANAADGGAGLPAAIAVIETATQATIGTLVDVLGQTVETVVAAVNPDDEDSIEAAERLYGQGISRAKKVVHELFDEHIADAHKLHKGLTEKRKKLLDPLDYYAGRLGGAASMARRELARREQAVIEEEARRQRQELEESAREAAAAAEAQGEKDLAAKIIERVAVMPPPAAPTAAMRAGTGTGMSYLDTWRAEVVSIRDLCRAIADGKAPEDLVEPNMGRLNAIARALKGTMSVPGVQAKKDTGLRASGR
jgi:rRNA processing protein Gar1